MDFFGHQDQARRRTLWLVVGFVISLLVLVVVIDALALGGMALAGDGRVPRLDEAAPALAFLTLIVLALVGLGSAYKSNQLATGGGAAVARMLGGRRILEGGESVEDRRLANVVEEMAIASGLPVPQVYVIEGQKGINAFAAGVKPGDAIIGVTRGALDQLSRDELQGVVAHEFSHILNGDMRLNIRLLGLVHGILLLAITGRILVFSLRHVRARGKAGGVVAVLFLSGVALFLLGSIGYLAGKILKAAVNRQREYLADAAAVQFTRNPGGLSGALQKLRQGGSRVKHVRTSEVSHLFFGNALAPSFFGLLATHPPLEKRIERLTPGWRADRDLEEPRPRRRGTAERALHADEIAGLIGRLDATSPAEGADALRDVPTDVRAYISEPFSARAAVLAAVADPRPAVARPALRSLAALDEKVSEEAIRIQPHVAALGKEAALSTVRLAIPVLREMTGTQRAAFLEVLLRLVQSDGVVTLEEHALAELIALHLGARPPPRKRPTPEEIRSAMTTLLGILARSETDDDAKALYAFELGRAHVTAFGGLPAMPSDPPRAFHQALHVCRAATPTEKRNIVTAAAWTVSADGVLSPTEAALLRLVVDALEAPMPRLPVLDPTPAT